MTLLDPPTSPDSVWAQPSVTTSPVISTRTSGIWTWTLPQHRRLPAWQDFQITLKYKVGPLVCRTTLRGLYGPVIVQTLPANSSNTSGPFAIGANVYDPDPGGSIDKVIFEVLDSSGTSIAVFTEYTSPYCLGGDSGGVCRALRPFIDNWPGTTQRIVNGTYNDPDPRPGQRYHRQSTRGPNHYD
jgi:hypothetical protein